MATDSKMIRSFKCFENLSRNQIEKIAEISNSLCYSPGHVMFEQGEHGEYLYLLVEGDVEVLYKESESSDHQVDTVSCEDLIGCAALVPPYYYTATQRCLTKVEVLEIETEALRKLIDQDPKIGLSMQTYIIERLNNRVLNLRQKALA
jgi:CRP-like cAMP-binding protein